MSNPLAAALRARTRPLAARTLIPGPSPDRRLLVSGRHVRARGLQMTAWSAAAGFLGAAFVAGLYFAVLEVRWYVHVGPVHFQLFWLKPWWDSGMGFVRSGNWPLYRHVAFRDLPEPAFATMAVMTLLARPRWWDTRVGTARLVTAPLILVAATFAMGLGGVWLLDFALPDAWHAAFSAAGHPGFRVPAGPLGKLQLPELALGFLMGRALHRLWAPVGATLQGYQLDRAVARAQGRGRAPLWVSLPVMPPVIRERFSQMWREGRSGTAGGRVNRWVIGAMTLLIVLVTALGVTAHYWVGTLGHSVPYLAP